MGLWPVAFVLSGFCVLSPLAWADSFFSAFAAVNVGDGFGDIVCTTGLQGGARKSAATANLTECPLFGGSGKAAVSMSLGTASVSASGPLPDFPHSVTGAGAWFVDTGTISGNGFLSLSGSVSGGDGALNVFLFSGDSTLATACVEFPSSNPFCARPSWSASVHVTDGMPLGIKLTISCDALAGTDCVFADPITLNLSPGVVFHSSFPGFLTGSTPEPGTLALLGSGVLGLAGVIRRKLSV